MPALLAAGWALERAAPKRRAAALVGADDLREPRAARLRGRSGAGRANCTPRRSFKIRDLGVALSDRRAVKVLKLRGRVGACCAAGRGPTPSDLWVLRYVWDRAEQIGPLGSLVEGMLREHPADAAHPQARPAERVDAEGLAKALADAEAKIAAKPTSLAEVARLREELTRLADRAAWVADDAARKHLAARAGELLRQVGP